MSQTSDTTVQDASPRLRNFHITFFAVVLGMAGFSLAVQRTADPDGQRLVPALEVPASLLLALTACLFVLVSLIYTMKAIRYPQAVVGEFNHPVKINFFPLVAKILLVLSVASLDRHMQTSYYLWVIGTALQFISSLVIISVWIRQTHFKIEHMTPAWFIPIVGSLIVPIAGVPHGFIELSWFFFSIGLIFWLVLFTVVMYRMFFHQPLPERLLPTLCILFAPPAIAFISYTRLEGLGPETGPDAFARVLYHVSLFLFILILLKLHILAKIRFYLSWWAYSFPLAAKVLATIVMFEITEAGFYRTLVMLELTLLAGIIVLLLAVTIRAVLRAEICVEE